MDKQPAFSVMVVDQHEEVCESLARRLERLPGLKVVAHTDNLIRAAELAHESSPDVIVVDFAWGAASRPDILRWFTHLSPHSRFVVYSSYYTDDEREAFQSAGASRCLLKGMSIRAFGEELRKVLARPRPGIELASSPVNP
jgi:DNA-binding NarL/FixJ family response regulator